MSSLSEHENLLLLAEGDLRVARQLEECSDFDNRYLGFHLQQSVEKALKAWLSIRGRKPKFTHSLASLLSELDGLDVDAAAFWDLVELSPYAVQFRYELADLGITLDRAGMLAMTQKLIDHVRHLAKELES